MATTEETTPSEESFVAIERGQMSGRYFTQWRIDALEELMNDVVFNFGTVPLLTVENAKVWYDEPNDFHMLSFESNGNRVEVRFYKAFSSKINGEDGWVGCPRYCISRFSKHLRDACKR